MGLSRIMKKKHILIVSQYFFPEQFRINDICEEWVKRGYEVTVLTGIPNYPQGKFYEGYGLIKKRNEKYKGINIIRLPIISRGHNAIGLVLNYFSFVISGVIWKLFTKIKADYVFIYEVSPMTQALPGVWYSKRKKIPCYIYIMDLWPENIEYTTGINNKFLINAIQKMVDYIYRSCDKIFVSSENFINAIKLRGIEEEAIKFWPQYAEDYYRPLIDSKCVEIPQDGIFNIIFAGNIGVAQGLDILPVTACVLKNKSYKVRFNIVGDGRAKAKLIQLVNDHGVSEYFNFIDKQPSQRIPELISACDINLICLSKSKVFEMTLPAKLQSSLACGKPVLVSADGEIQDVIKNAKAGLCSDAADAKMLADKIIELINLDKCKINDMSKNAIKYSDEHYNKEKLLNEIDQYFK